MNESKDLAIMETMAKQHGVKATCHSFQIGVASATQSFSMGVVFACKQLSGIDSIDDMKPILDKLIEASRPLGAE